MLFVAIVAALVFFLSGCFVAESGPGGREYYYYPDYEVYYYPHVGAYYWYEGGDWHHGPRPPARFVLREQDRVRIEWNREPHQDHDRIRRDYPGHRDQDRDRDGDRDRNRDRDRSR
jgi:hypothetical protein